MRDRHQIAAVPFPGDVLADSDTMYRVIAVAEDHVWMKQYGRGYRIVSMPWWKDEMESKTVLTVIHDGQVSAGQSHVISRKNRPKSLPERQYPSLRPIVCRGCSLFG